MYPQELLSSEVDEMEQYRSSIPSEHSGPRSKVPQKKPVSEVVKFVEQALPLITCNPETDVFEINQEVVQMMNSIKGPIGVVAVAGMYRTGKSYLLNRVLLNRQRGFGVGPSINPCTKGIWVWGTPLSGFTAEG